MSDGSSYGDGHLTDAERPVSSVASGRKLFRPRDVDALQQEPEAERDFRHEGRHEDDPGEDGFILGITGEERPAETVHQITHGREDQQYAQDPGNIP